MSADLRPARQVALSHEQPHVEPVALPTRVPGLLITIESTIEERYVESFYELYLAAFAPMRTRAAARQVLYRTEFVDEMADPRVWKFVAWNDRSEPVALATMTRDLTCVPWISAEYYAARYPEHAALSTVYYLGFILSLPDERRNRVVWGLLRAVVARLSADKAVCVFDVCAFNNETMNFGRQLEKVASRWVDLTCEIIDTQTYYGATFT